jgi:hypothetical protein
LRNSTVLIMITLLITLTGCSVKSYENFKKNNDFAIGSVGFPVWNKHSRKNYDKDHYIYIHTVPKGCIHAFITNRNDKPEKVISWHIISGKEFCKEKIRWAI